jgi:tetratricopeptide (TPR) repeat protein
MDMLQVGRTLVSLEREEEALPILEAARAMADQYMGTKNVPYLVLNVNICFAYAKLGKAQEAEAALERARPIAQSLPEGAPPAALFKQAQAVVFLAKGQIPQAKSALEAAQTAFVKLGNLGAPYLVSIEKLQAQIRQKG